jgi:hypothetical protein
MGNSSTQDSRRRWMGVGRSDDADARRAGARAARLALAGDEPRLLVVFGSIRYDPAELLAGIRESAGDTPVIGCSTHGEIGPDGARDGSVVITAFGGTGISVSTAATDKIRGRQRDAGAEIAECVSDLDEDRNRVLILLTDGMSRHQEEILRGAYDVLGATVPLFGGASADGRQMTGTYQLHGEEVLHQGIVAAAIATDGPIGIGVRHGWRRAGDAMIVTSSANGRVHRLDDMPALDAYLDRLEAPPEAYHDPAAFSRWALTRPLGIQRRSGVEARNLSHDVDFAGRSIGGGGNIPEGALTWAMEGDSESILDAHGLACQDAVEALGDQPPVGLIALSCAGCRAVLGDEGIQRESVRIAGQAKGAPFAGFYTYGEIARIRGVNGFHNQTLVVLALG